MDPLLPNLTEGEVAYAFAQRELGPLVSSVFVPHKQARVQVESSGSDAGANLWWIEFEPRPVLARLLLLAGWSS
jgi:hypothetical protein